MLRADIKRHLRENGLSLAALAIFVASLIGQAIAGWRVFNEQLSEHGQQAITFATYVRSGDFIESVFENWESEFLQMGLFVMLTKFLKQKGSSESKALDEPSPEDEDPRTKKHRPDAPWPVRRGGIVLA